MKHLTTILLMLLSLSVLGQDGGADQIKVKTSYLRIDSLKVISQGTTKSLIADENGNVGYSVNSSQWTVSGSYIYNGNTGSVGIGTSAAPRTNTKLDVNGGIGVGRLGLSGTYVSSQIQQIWSISPDYIISIANNNAGNIYGLTYNYEGNGTGISGFGHHIGFRNNGTLYAAISLTTGKAYFAGNVGIGTGNTAPTEKLDVAGKIKSTALQMTTGAGTGKVLTSDASGNATWATAVSSTQWTTSGNNIYTSNTGNVGIGTTTPLSKLSVDGTIRATEVLVKTNINVPDYVFNKNYPLLSLTQLEIYLETNKHLPEIPSARDIEANGIGLSEMNMLLLKKVEELTLYVIGQQKEIESLKRKVNNTVELNK